MLVYLLNTFSLKVELLQYLDRSSISESARRCLKSYFVSYVAITL